MVNTRFDRACAQALANRGGQSMSYAWSLDPSRTKAVGAAQGQVAHDGAAVEGPAQVELVGDVAQLRRRRERLLHVRVDQ